MHEFQIKTEFEIWMRMIFHRPDLDKDDLGVYNNHDTRKKLQDFREQMVR